MKIIVIAIVIIILFILCSCKVASKSDEELEERVLEKGDKKLTNGKQ